MLSRLSIQWKITLLAGLCLLAIVTLLVGASLYQSTHSAALVKTSSSSMLEDSARLLMAARGELQVTRIQRAETSDIDEQPGTTIQIAGIGRNDLVVTSGCRSDQGIHIGREGGGIDGTGTGGNQVINCDNATHGDADG